MTLIAEQSNGTVSETSANTGLFAAVACPNAAGAKRVFLKRATLIPYNPDNTATKEASVTAAVQVGKISGAIATSLATPGTIHSVSNVRLTDGTDSIYQWRDGENAKEGPWPVPQDPGDRGFYVGVGIMGAACTTVRSVRYLLEWLVER